MARDYKNARANNRRGGNRRTRGSAKGGANHRTPGWVWLLTGLSVGLLVALGVYLYNRNHEAQLAKQATVLEKNTADTKPTSKKETKEKTKLETPKVEEPRFDFYTLLPKQEVVIPEKEIREEQQRLEAKDNVIYSLQAGSFLRYEDADTLKAQLAMLGIEARIQAVTSKEVTWQRVLIGPLINSREVNRIRNRLNSNNINTLVIKEQKR